MIPEVKIEESKLTTDISTMKEYDEQSSAQNSSRSKNSEFTRSASAVVMQNFRNTNEIHRKISTPIRAHNDSFINQLSSTSSLYAVPESRLSHSSRLNRLTQHQRTAGTRPPKRSPSTSRYKQQLILKFLNRNYTFRETHF